MSWKNLLDGLEKIMGKRPENLEAVLFLIGVQELGKGPKSFSKEEKKDLVHLGVCSLLSQRGIYTFLGRDEDGWPHYKQLKSPDLGPVKEQEGLLMNLAIKYFEPIINENHYI